MKAIRRAGLEPWPKLFHNLRATRETELAADFPLHIVCKWIGNSIQVATRHYLQVRDEDFERAAGSAHYFAHLKATAEGGNAMRELNSPSASPRKTRKRGNTPPHSKEVSTPDRSRTCGLPFQETSGSILLSYGGMPLRGI